MMTFLDKFKNIDMLHGSVWDKLILFSIPLALTAIFQVLFNSADVLMLGHFVGDSAMAAVGNNVPIIGLIVSLFVGLSIGSNVVVARYIGMNDKNKANEAVHTSIEISIILGVVITIFTLLISSYCIKVLDVPNEVFDEALVYLRWYLVGLPFISIYNFEAALYRSVGNTKDPLFALIIGGVFNILGNLIAVNCGFGIQGVAIATSLSNLLCALYLFIKLLHEDNVLKLSFNKFSMPNLRQTKAIVNVGLPAGIQGMVFSIANLVIQSAINSLGRDAMAASAASFIVEVNLYSVVSAFGLATTTFVSQNFGAGAYKRTRHITNVSLGICILISCLFTIPVLLFPRPVIHLFTDNPQIVELTVIRIYFLISIQQIAAFLEIYSGAMRGYGYSLPPAILTLLCVCGIRLTWVYTYFESHQTFASLLAAYPLSWVITSLFLTILYFYHQKKLKAKYHF